MTVSYQYEVASSTSGGFTRLLFMWRGSLYKLIYRELLLFLGAFGLLSALYRNTFNSDQRKIFEKMVMYCDTFINLIPLSFVLGFYVAYVAGRWWQQYMAIPWPDKIMHSIALYVSGDDDHARMVRRTLMRYLNLTLILVLRSISSAVKRRFPTLEHVVESGFMTSVELEMFQSVPSVEFNTYWIPCTWFISLLKESKKNQQIEDSQGLHIIMEEFNEFRSKCGLLWSYDWVSIPLVYTQVVTIATYSFFLAALVGRQYVDAAKKPLQMEIDIYLPVFTILQFFFFMGLLKVAEQLINPFGDDDEDFELNWLIDRHTKVSYLGVDILMTSAPPLVKDMYFDQVDLTLPYTEASVAYKKKTYRGSVHNMTVPEDKHTMFLPEISEEDEDKAPTPRSSLSNVQSMAYSRPTEPAPVTAAAAGTWRSNFPSTQSFHKIVEMDSELEAGSASTHSVEMPLDMATFPKKQNVNEVDFKASGSGGSKLCRSESVPAKKPVFVPKSMLGWPSSSTLAHSDVSFRYSEQSIEMQSCYNSSSNFGLNSDRTPEQECCPEVFSSISATGRSESATFSGHVGGNYSGNFGGSGNEGRSCRRSHCGSGDGAAAPTDPAAPSGGFVGAINRGVGGGGGGSSCDNSDRNCNGVESCVSSSGGGRGEISKFGDAGGGDSGITSFVDSGRYDEGDIFGNNTGSVISVEKDIVDFPFVKKNRFSLGLNVTCNNSSYLSQTLPETPAIQRQYEHYLCKPKLDTEYVTFKKDFRTTCLAKVKSCPKLVLVKRQHSANNGRKKGVRWKPMPNNVSNRDVRRQTIEILPVTPDPSGTNIFFPTKASADETEFPNQSFPDIQCLWCRKQYENRQTLLKRTVSGDSEHLVNTSVDSESNSSFIQELCPLHYRINMNESFKGCPIRPPRLVLDKEGFQPKTLPFQERRATVSTVSLTGSELEAKRWQSRSFWERGFFKKMKLLYSRKGVKSVPAAVKRTSLFISNKRSLSQSLPNIAFPYFQSNAASTTPEPLTSKYLTRVMPTVQISDTTLTESEDSSRFASIMEIQEEDELNNEDHSTNVTEDKTLPMISINLPVISAGFASVASTSNNELLNTPSQDSSWKSADWTGIIGNDNKNLGSDDNAEQVSSAKDKSSVSFREETHFSTSNNLQEVIVDDGNDLLKKQWFLENDS